ncbi:MAG: PTS transporter subunit EIIC [Lachnospiraceae bacterium]|nr:PTS transporter subunit EIIC [Lachnospiraceae bacterium]
MKKLIDWLENSFAPKMTKVNTNVWIVTIKDSIMQVLPFIFLGTIFCCLAIIENYVKLPFSFWTPFGWTMSKISLLVAFLIPFNFCEKKRYRKQRLIAGLTGLLLFMMIVTPQFEADKTIGFGHSSLGAGGMFVAIISGIVTCWIFGLFAKFSFFKDDSPIPDFVRQWFDALLPIGLTIVLGWVVVLILNVDLYTIIVGIFMPLQKFLNTWYGFTFFMFFTCFIYSMGISSWVLTPIGEPVRLATIAKNLTLVAAGTASASTLGIYTEGLVYTCYMWVGGIGCTLPLVIMLMRSRSKELSALGKACLVPSFFNINEPVIFGCIAWNPYLMLPMWIQGIVIPLLTYFATKVIRFAPLPHVQFELWYSPYPVGTIMNTMSQGAGAIIRALIFLAISVTVSSIIWYPFFKAYENNCLLEEKKAEQN